MSLTYTEIAEICHEIVNLSELKFDRLKGISIDYDIQTAMDYEPNSETIRINPILLSKQHNKKFKEVITFEDFIRIVFYHELGHAMDYSENRQKLIILNQYYIQVEENPTHKGIEDLKNKIIQETMDSEKRAWEYAELLIPNYIRDYFHIVKLEAANNLENDVATNIAYFFETNK
ncbi:hypothetical protein HRF59_13155 [Bacillus velezensis]|uniref:hypothetical protein n=1 Tax=Bacillus amyloliquefaciens group TaxID=1938374 RepID=UPI00039BC2EE|nr:MULTISPECIES: hypothetical protein [Bacillus amyloliquefaciens group]ATU26811.1 hypothetical protein BMJ37_08650 [Bacillus velezensis]AUS16194.1 hypothetical protein C0W57_08425 [Bacillus velezensis]MCA1232323.1 hypothetical protein [Bacillus velezensis]MCA1310527.1 hypothetical protein [Bacillus velezensis]MCA1329706.1 hypothetical protein [Bacillus velezensis]